MSGPRRHLVALSNQSVTLRIERTGARAGLALASARPVLEVCVTPRFVELLTSWRVSLAAEGMSAKTIRTRHYGVTAMSNHFDPVTATTEQVRSWLADQRSGWTRATYHGTARAWFAYVVEQGDRTDNPMAVIRRPREPRRVPRPVTDEDLETAIDQAVGNVRAFLLLAAYAGLRVHEIAKLRGEDITAKHIRVLGKGNREDVIPTHPLVWELAQQMPRRGWWFPSPRSQRGHILSNTVTQQISRYFTELGIDATAHMVRHTFCTRVLEASGRDIVRTQRLARHASPRTTVGYLFVSDEDLRDVIFNLDDGRTNAEDAA